MLSIFTGRILPEWDDAAGADAWFIAAFLRLCARLGSLFLFIAGIIALGVGYAVIGVAMLLLFFILAVAWLLEEQDYQ